MTEADTTKNKAISCCLSLKAIIQDIQQCNGPVEELNELNQMGRTKITELKTCIEALKTLAVEELRPNDRLTFENDAKDLEDELRVTLAAFQKANVQCVLKIQKANRLELLGADSESLNRHRVNKAKEDLEKYSGELTERLVSIRRNLSDTTQRNSEVLQTLVTSSNVVDGTRVELDSQGNVISQSGKLLAKYGRRERTDNFLIIFATAFFFACVVYIIQKRLW